MATKKSIPDENALLDNLGKIAYTLDKTYLARLTSDYGVLPFDEYYNKDEDISFSSNIRALQVKRWVYDKDEKIADCFKNVLSVFAGSDTTLALVLQRTPRETKVFFVVKNEGVCRNEDSKENIDLLASALRGNFAGSDISVIAETDGGEDTKKLFEFKGMEALSCLCNIPSEKSEDYIAQGIDKLLNGVVPADDSESYYIVIVAEAQTQAALREVLSGYEEMATALTPFSGYQFQIGQNQTESNGTMESLSHTEGISTSITKTHSVNGGINIGFKAMGTHAGYGYSQGTTEGKNLSNTKTTGSNYALTIGSSEGATYTYKSYLVQDLLKRLEESIQRISKSQSSGLWKTASYVLSADSKSSKNIAHFLRAITQGDQSYIEVPYVQTWAYESKHGVAPFDEIKKYLEHFTHPVFFNLADGMSVMPTANVSTTELANAFSFPRHSIPGVPVIQCARFGREPHSYVPIKGGVPLGCVYHMHQAEPQRRTVLDRNSLTAHTFITGSTGSGKSNTIYVMLDMLAKDQNVHFLVIEPAKGEYKDVFGGREDVAVYGTNPFKMPLLKINPFSFPEDVHILEHIDRLIEIFNACWPMYAAMPAILKDAVERAYTSIGWSLTSSCCTPRTFPTFANLMDELPQVIKSTDYSSDTKGDYIGALLTRIKSLTNGINGQIFCAPDELPAAELFDKNVIVDISRVGSNETKSLLMGMLIMKLQEYRMSEGGMNSTLRHITVLEEAHNLLRRTSAEQSQEGANLQGKSVEMIANAIAEMRTYGEGFIIADQSPGLMDLSVICNTNTKIIMRLPDESDRELVGKAASLNDQQIADLARLRCGVAAVYQNDWLEPVLCQVDHFEDGHPYVYRPILGADNLQHKFFSLLLKTTDAHELVSEDVDAAKQWISRLNVGNHTKKLMNQCVSGRTLTAPEKAILLYNTFEGKHLAIRKMQDKAGGIEADKKVDSQIDAMYGLGDINMAADIRKIIFAHIESLGVNLEQQNTVEVASKDVVK